MKITVFLSIILFLFVNTSSALAQGSRVEGSGLQVCYYTNKRPLWHKTREFKGTVFVTDKTLVLQGTCKACRKGLCDIGYMLKVNTATRQCELKLMGKPYHFSMDNPNIQVTVDLATRQISFFVTQAIQSGCYKLLPGTYINAY